MKIILLIILTSISWATIAQREVYTKSNIAINGYDPVAYFIDSRPLKGRKELSYVWKGATWIFTNAKNLDLFKSMPETYAPQYGGYCAYGVAEGHKAPTSPDAWTIVDGKLYLNYDKQVKALWKKDQEGYIKAANDRWDTVKQEKD